MKYIISAADYGIIGGHPDGSFKPADTVITAEFLKMLALAFGLQKDLKHPYTDVPSDAWFAPYAGIADKYGLFPNRGSSSLLPEKPLTRGEVAVAINRLVENR